MEAHDATTGDPFAQTDGDEGDPFAPKPEADAEIEAETPPVVDREGQPVEATPEAAPAAEELPVETEALPAEVPAEPVQEEQPEAQPATPEEAAAQPEATPEPPAPAAAPQEAAETAQTASEPEVEAQPEATAQEPDTPPQKGKSQLRYYKVLYQTAEKQWTEADLDESDPDVVRLKSEDDADGSLWLAARNNDHATRLAWKVLGTPQQGVTAFPVPRGAWKPKRIKPAPPRPERERLVIS